MSLDRLPSGNVRARLTVDGVRYSATFATEAEAQEWLVVTRGRAVAARAVRSVTVREYASRWLGEFVVGAANLDRYRRALERHIIPALGGLVLSEVAEDDISELVERVRSYASPVVAQESDRPAWELFADAREAGTSLRSPVPPSG